MDPEFRELKRLARKGDVEAQYRVGLEYLISSSGRLRKYLGIRWLRKAALCGHTGAMIALSGHLRKTKPLMSYFWLHRAGELGSLEAQGGLAAVHLGLINLYSSNPNLIDPEQGFSWAVRAACNGGPDNWEFLASLFANGLGVTQSDKEAFRWYAKAAEGGNDLAKEKLIPYLLYGYGTQQDCTSAGWLMEYFARRKRIKYQYQLGMLYLQGEHLDPDPKKAHYWLSQCAKLGNTKAMVRLGKAFAEGDLFPRNPVKAFQYYNMAAVSTGNHPEAWTKVGEFYASGQVVPQDYAQSLKWFSKAALLKYHPAVIQTAQMYEHGQGVPADKVRACAFTYAFQTQGSPSPSQKVGKHSDPVTNQ